MIYSVLGFFMALHATIVASAVGHDVDMNRIVLVGMGVLFMLIGNWLPKMRSNFFVGIRTPWTLSSEHTRRRTHQVGGRLFVGLGAMLLLVGALLPGSNVVGVIAGGAALVAFGLVTYSYLVWRDAPDRGASTPDRS